jgi:hypothetical protein
MKKLMFIIAIISLLVACNGKTVTIKSGYNTYEASIAPAMENNIPRVGEEIAIMKPLGFAAPATNGYVYNSSCWSQEDTSSLGGLIKRSIIEGEVINVR